MNKLAQMRPLGGRVVKWKGRVASIAPALASVSVVALLASGAFGQTVIDTPLVGEQVISIDEDVTVTADGEITVPRSSSDQAALYIDMADYSSVVTNNGLIEIYETSAIQFAAGIWLSGNLTGGSIVNNGEISAEVGNSSSASAYGILVSGNLEGTILNSGDIVAWGHVSSTAFAYGVYIGGSVSADGSIVNVGTIEAIAEGYTTAAFARGIEVVGDLYGTIENSGSITASASIASAAAAWGIRIGGDVHGSITNSGTITIEVSAVNGSSGSAVVYGIRVGGLASDGSIANTGTITATAKTACSSATAYGIKVTDSDLNGAITNSGTITAIASIQGSSSDSSAYAFGIRIDHNLNGSVTNSGTITATANETDDYAYAYGVNIRYDDLNGTIESSGTISATATSVSAEAHAYGIRITNGGVGESGLIDISGVMDVTAVAGSSDAKAYGIYVYDDMDGSISNSGTIKVEAIASSVSAYGITATVGENGTVTNSGLIEVRAAGESYTYAVGINLSEMAGQFTNTGSIIATEGESLGRAIWVNGDGGLVTLNTRGFLVGNIILVNDVDLNVQGDVGRSVHWTVNAYNWNSGADWTNHEGYRGTEVFERDNGATIEYATLDRSGLVAMRQASADAGFLGIDTLVSKTSAAAANSVKAADGTGGSHLMPFVAAASQSRTYSGGDTALSQDVQSSSISVGNTMALQNGLFLGLGAGKLSGSADVNYRGGPASEADQQGAFLGVALSGSFDKINFAAAIIGGRMQIDSSRFVNDNTVFDGIVSEDASVDSTFRAAEVAVSGHFDIGNGIAVVPNSVLKYSQHQIDAYSETGSGAAADVGAQKFGAFEGEVGLALEKTLANGVFSGGISLMSRRVSGYEDVGVTMIGDTEVVDATIASLNAKKLSLGYAASFSAAGQFNLGYETLLGSDAMSGGKISGQLRFSF